MEQPPIVQQVADAILASMKAQDPLAYIEAGDDRVHAIDGDFDMAVISKAAIAAVKANLQPRITHDEEGVIAMLDGEKRAARIVPGGNRGGTAGGTRRFGLSRLRAKPQTSADGDPYGTRTRVFRRERATS